MPDPHEVAAGLSTLPPGCSPSPTGSSSVLSDCLVPVKEKAPNTMVSYSPRASSRTVADLLQSDTGSLGLKASLPQDATAWSIGKHCSTLPCDAEERVVTTAASNEELVHHSGVRLTPEASLKITPNV
jgi:hypothetical protein